MRGSRVGAVCAVAIVVMLAACTRAAAPSQATITSEPSPTATLPLTGPSSTPTVAPSPTATPEPSPAIDPLEPQFADVSAVTFSNGAAITNEWLPLRPGRRWIWDGVTLEEGERVPHRITFTVTSLTKHIGAVQTVVAWVEDYSDGELVEEEIAFYAQDDSGTVWYFGEHPEEFEDGELAVAPTWIAGVADARPGIKMFADPATHTQTWYQGWAPEVEWSDFGRLDELQPEDCVAAGCFTDVARFAESSDGEDGIFQLKSYAKGVGEIRTGWRGEAESREELELKSATTLKGERLAEFDEKALDLEAHAYRISAKVYGKTDRMMLAE